MTNTTIYTKNPRDPLMVHAHREPNPFWIHPVEQFRKGVDEAQTRRIVHANALEFLGV